MYTRSSGLLFAALLCVILPVRALGQPPDIDSIYLSREEFQYADNPKYTFLGGTPRRETDVQLWPSIGMGVAYTGLFVALHYNQSNAWWKDQSGGWHVIEDIEYAKGLDKCGHFFGAYAMSSLSGDMLMEAGFSEEPATLIGAGMGLAFETYVEINDGYAKNWGFSPTDAIANAVGTGYYVLQYYVPFFENFTPRWSYVPPEWTGDSLINERPATFIDDYNGTTFWLACNVNNLLPTSAEPYWPDWLMFSFGYGIRNYARIDENGALEPVSRRFLFGLDYDWVKIIPESEFGFFNYLRQALNYIRLPGPTLEVGDDGVTFGFLYPFLLVVPI